MYQMTVQKWMTALLLVLALAVSGLNMAQAVQVRCSVRNDWGTYTVVRGDTLNRIAQRFNTTTSALVQGNCLQNANLIFFGQRLHVPGSSQSGTPPPGGSSSQFTTGATFQQYENGFMVWRADNGEIRVYVGPIGGDAGSIGELTIYSARQYSGLSSQQFSPPTGRIAPILGFGRVWGNFPSIRQQLGWALSAEQAYTMTAQTQNGVVIAFTVFGGRFVNYRQGNQWTVSGFIHPTPLPSPLPDPTIIPSHATFQQYENGFMIWRADIGTIYIFGLGLGTYSQSSYASLPDNDCTGGAPVGFVCPINGFGRIWANDTNTRRYLGWAKTTEQGYLATVVVARNNVSSISLPDGRTVFIDGGSWHW
jgi:hypothetical protein